MYKFTVIGKKADGGVGLVNIELKFKALIKSDMV